MFDQTQNQNFGAPMMGGYQFNGMAPTQAPKVMNVLTNEEINELKQSTSQFSLGLTQKEVLQGACNHRSPDGTQDTLYFDPEKGTARCTICGYEFRPLQGDEDPNSIKEAADKIVDILQTIKIMYTELPAGAAREYFQIIPLIGKIPQLFEFAAKNFSKHEYNAWNYSNRNMGGAAMFQNLNNIFGASQQPMMGGMGQAQQYGYNNYAAPQQPVGYPNANPFGYVGAPQQPQFNGYMPATQGFQYTPNQTPQQPQVAPTVTAPAAPATAADATATETVTQKVNV